jgi:hypothetical protein
MEITNSWWLLMDETVFVLVNSEGEGTAKRIFLTIWFANLEWGDWVVSDNFAFVVLRNVTRPFFLTPSWSCSYPSLDETCGNCFTVICRRGILLICLAEESLMLHVEGRAWWVVITSILALIKCLDIIMSNLKSIIIPIVWFSSTESIMGGIALDVALVAWIASECKLIVCFFLVNEAVFVLVNSEGEGTAKRIFLTIWFANLEWGDWVVSGNFALVVLRKVTRPFFLTPSWSCSYPSLDEASWNCFSIVCRLGILLQCGAEESLALHVESNT